VAAESVQVLQAQGNEAIVQLQLNNGEKEIAVAEQLQEGVGEKEVAAAEQAGNGEREIAIAEQIQTSDEVKGDSTVELNQALIEKIENRVLLSVVKKAIN